MTDRKRDRARAALVRVLAGTVRRAKAAAATPLPDDVLSHIRARASPMMKGPEYAAWYEKDVPLLLDEIDRLRYELEDAKRAK